MSYTEHQSQLRMKCNMRVKLEIQALPKLSIDRLVFVIQREDIPPYSTDALHVAT